MSRKVPLVTARIEIDLRQMTAYLVTGAPDNINSDQRVRTYVKLDFFGALDAAARDLPEEDKIFFIKDLIVCEMPHMSDWAYRDDLPIFRVNGARYKTFRTRDEAKAKLREMLQEMLADVDAPDGYVPRTWHGDGVQQGV